MDNIKKWKKASDEYTKKFRTHNNYLLAPELHMLDMLDNGCYMFINSGSSIPSKEKWEVIKNVVDAFYEAIPAEEIEKYNNLPLNRSAGDVDSGKKNKKRKVKGFVYFIKADNSLIKIGKTKDLKQRLDHFTSKLPYELELLHSIETDDYTSLEMYFHEKFADKRGRGEWFHLTNEDIEEVKRYE